MANAGAVRTLSDEAQAVHAQAVILDLHADTTKLMSYGYDIHKRHRTPWPLSSFAGHVDLPRMAEGNLSGQFFAMWTLPLPQSGCYADVHRQIDALERATGERPGQPRLLLCRTADEVRQAHAAKAHAALLGIEGAHALEGGSETQLVERLTTLARRGVRYLGLLHFSRNLLGHPAMGLGQDHHKGLSALGCAIVDACARLGVIVDLAHINRRGFFDALARRPGPVFVTHTGLAGVTRMWRNIDDEQIRAVARTGGAIGVIFAPRFVGQDGLGGIVAHLRHLLDIGGEDTVAIGSDWDGFVRPAKGLASPADLPYLTQALLQAGLSVRVIHKLLGGNALRVLAAHPPLAR